MVKNAFPTTFGHTPCTYSTHAIPASGVLSKRGNNNNNNNNR